MIVKNNRGIEFFVRIVKHGDAYGLDDCLTHDKWEPMIEFYDTRYKKNFGPRGQFVSRYYASTLASTHRAGDLCLHGGVADWTIDAEAFAPVVALARTLAPKVSP